MRSGGRIGTAAAVVTAAVAALPTTAHADAVFQAQTAATAVHVVLTQQPASSIVTASLVDDATGYAASAYDSSGGSEGQAASVYPGNLVVQGPSLFCSELFPCPATPPAYPLLADASYPRRPSDTATANQAPVGSGPFVVTPADATARASADGNIGSTTAGGVSALTGTPAALTVGASSATSHVTSTGSGLVVHVESVASDIDAGVLLHIGSVHTIDDVTVSHTGAVRDAPTVTVAGVTVAGAAATIDDTGIHVAGQDGPDLAQQLTQQGIAVHLVGAHKHDAHALARSDAVGLEIDLTAPVSGAPYVPNPLSTPPFDQIPGVDANGTYLARVTLGAVGIVAGANANPVFSLGGITPLPSAPSSANHTADAPGAAGVAPAAAIPPARAPVVSAPGGVLHAILDGFTTDLANLYAVLALGTGALFVGWRGIVAARRRRPAVGRRG